jgi:hypothetical protein
MNPVACLLSALELALVVSAGEGLPSPDMARTSGASIALLSWCGDVKVKEDHSVEYWDMSEQLRSKLSPQLFVRSRHIAWLTKL